MFSISGPCGAGGEQETRVLPVGFNTCNCAMGRGVPSMQWTASDARASPVTGMLGSACATYPPQSFLA